jgi:hypothetical protein
MKRRIVSRCTALNQYRAGNTKVRCKRMVTKGQLCYMHLEKLQHLRVKRSTIPNARNGLFTTVARKKQEKLADYTGQRISAAQAKRSKSAYIFQPNKTTFIDARKSNEAVGRYANDGRSPAKNNSKLAYNSKAKTACVKATKNIQAGKEILVSYGPEYWKR